MGIVCSFIMCSSDMYIIIAGGYSVYECNIEQLLTSFEGRKFRSFALRELVFSLGLL